MKKHKIVMPGILCIFFLAASIWYSVRYNESRLIVPTDLETYQFSPKDLPMMCSIVMTIVYGCYLLVCVRKTGIQQKKNVLKTNRTRKLNPKLGLLGFLGFLGFTEGWAYFVFWGFFGFFYEAKMSDTLMDERFRENKIKAQLMALKAAFGVIIAAFLFLDLGEYFMIMSIEHLLVGGQILIALSIALAIFLSEYLLYRYDHDDCGNEDSVNEKSVDG
ncbi:MAG: DUF3796 domain-containing protein [Lachnospiraceae bacterium]|nr:DUF3796 domain-containing protein [Lachnospiraceae bacterium]